MLGQVRQILQSNIHLKKKSGFVVLQRTSIIIFGANFGKENLYKMVPDTQLKTKIKTTTNNIQRNDRR